MTTMREANAPPDTELSTGGRAMPQNSRSPLIAGADHAPKGAWSGGASLARAAGLPSPAPHIGTTSKITGGFKLIAGKSGPSRRTKGTFARVREDGSGSGWHSGAKLSVVGSSVELGGPPRA
jgi:hypothetical protein